MTKLPLLVLTFIFGFLPICAQYDVNLFDYWEFYSDAGNCQYKTSCSYAFQQLAQRKVAIAQLKTKEDYLEWQQWVKDKLQQLIGPFPEKTALNARVTGIIRKKDYQVEKIVYESMPGYYVTAALFIPNKRTGKTPAILYASGHTVNGFRSEVYQHTIINLVQKGFIVLAFDPVGQGERLQYFNEETTQSRFGPTHEHSYPGAQCYLSGYSPTKYFVWDGIRSVDYLLSREEVDPNRIGMTGRSGGGTQTAFIAALDERILAAAPEDFITCMEYILKSIGPQDAEQNLIYMIAEGLDHADLLTVRAPKPGLLIATTRDMFSIQGTQDTYGELRQFYNALGGADQIGMAEDDDGHTSTKRNREAMYAFFQKHLDHPGDPTDQEVEILKEEELWVTETGQLATSLQGETLFSLNKKTVMEQVAKLQSSRLEEEKHLALVTAAAKQLSGFHYPVEYQKAIFSGRYSEEKYVLEKYLIPGSGDYMLPVAVFRPSASRTKEVFLLLDDQGMANAAKQDSLIASFLRQGKSLVLFDVAGIGSLGPGYLKGDAYIDGASFNQWFAGTLTNRSLVGIRAQDILRIIAFLKTEVKGVHEISAIGFGTMGSELLHAAVFDGTIQNIVLVRPFLSFAEIALSPSYQTSFIPSTVAGAIKRYDLPDLMAALCPSKILIIDAFVADGSLAVKSKVTDLLTYPVSVFDSRGVGGNFIYLNTFEGQSFMEPLLNWIK